MAIREIIKVPNPILKKVSKPVDVVDDEIRKVLDDMLDTMYDAPGIGLAAIQIGIPLRMLVIDISSVGDQDNNEKDPQFFINPEIIDPSDDLSSFEEGCLSVPGIWEEIERPDQCIVKFVNRDGQKKKKKCKGLLATVIQHEMDHLEGIVFVDHLSRLKRDLSIKKSIKFQKIQQKKIDYLVIMNNNDLIKNLKLGFMGTPSFAALY